MTGNDDVMTDNDDIMTGNDDIMFTNDDVMTCKWLVVTCVAVPGRNRTLFCCVFHLFTSKLCNAELLLRAGLIFAT